jgi:hypothetical protein
LLVAALREDPRPGFPFAFFIQPSHSVLGIIGLFRRSPAGCDFDAAKFENISIRNEELDQVRSARPLERGRSEAVSQAHLEPIRLLPEKGMAKRDGVNVIGGNRIPTDPK